VIVPLLIQVEIGFGEATGGYLIVLVKEERGSMIWEAMNIFPALSSLSLGC
jgi:hypothetical protein